jgi:Na+/H+-dicarboxylate symporter
MPLHSKILIGLIAGAIVGGFASVREVAWLQSALSMLAPFGTAWVRLIMMTVLPLVVASLLVGVASLGDLRSLGRVGGKTLTFFIANTAIAATIGLVLALTIKPGSFVDESVQEQLAAQFQSEAAGHVVVSEGAESLADQLVAMIPRNPVDAATRLDLLQLIVFTVLFGAAVSVLPQARRDPVVAFFHGINDASVVVIHWVMVLAPPAVFALIAPVVGRLGLEILEGLLVYGLLVLGGLLLVVFGLYAVVLRLLAGVGPLTFYRRVARAPLVAFSTSSSNAALPVTMETAEEELGISKRIVSFVLPLGATMNMNGSALHFAVSTVFIAQVYGVPLGPSEHLTIVLTSTVAAVAGPGVPASGLISILIVLSATGLGALSEVGIALIVGMDRILDMLRTTVNVTGDLVVVAAVARTEGEGPTESYLGGASEVDALTKTVP